MIIENQPTKIIEVTQCDEVTYIGGCPFNYDTIACKAKTSIDIDGFVNYGPPDFENCPLRSGQIIVKLKGTKKQPKAKVECAEKVNNNLQEESKIIAFNLLLANKTIDKLNLTIKELETTIDEPRNFVGFWGKSCARLQIKLNAANISIRKLLRR